MDTRERVGERRLLEQIVLSPRDREINDLIENLRRDLCTGFNPQEPVEEIRRLMDSFDFSVERLRHLLLS